MSAVVANLDTSESPCEESDNETCSPENEMANPPKRSRKEQIKASKVKDVVYFKVVTGLSLGSA